MKDSVAIKLKKVIRDLGLEYFGRYYGTYAGVVADNADPKGLARLKVIVPDIYGNDTIESWALPKLFTGKDQVNYVVPEAGDPVWVTFQKGGDPRFPIWEGGWITEGNKQTGGPDLKVFRTKSGNMMEYDDAGNLMRLTSAQGRVLELNETISLGSSGNSAESAVLGDTLLDKLSQLIDLIVKIQVVNGGGQTGPPLNTAQFLILKQELIEILSQFVTLD